ncbi:FAD-binding dehydrogenase [Brevibacterium yomogidense]|uniref:FAD-binding dehydrogenase n=1 Tax=Brevibacterium yomogidense TaxID=946573 RepID=UPI0018DF3ACE|nr:FAD-binding dehydrogenase [Brevibacterium yomogidense]
MSSDVLVIGAGLSGLVAATEACDAGATVTILDQESEANLGGQAYWSFGGLFLVDSPEQRRMGVRDSLELARRDWWGSAQFEDHDHLPRQWAEAYLEFASGPKRAWLHDMGVRFFPIVGWAERGDGTAHGHGNSVPRFHITWGTGPGVLAPFVARAKDHIRAGRLRVLFRHRVNELVVEGGKVTGASGAVLAEDTAARGIPSSREQVGDFTLRADAVIVTSGGIGGNHDMVRAQWPPRLGSPPQTMLTGVPAYVDGSMMPIAQDAGAHILNPDRMWHYVEGIGNWDPVWPQHGIRILPGPSSLWIDARGNRLPDPAFPGFDTMATLRHLRGTGHDYSWFILNRRIIEKEFALSGSEQNPDLTGKSVRQLAGRLGSGAPAPVEAFLRHGEDFLQGESVEELVSRMNALTATCPNVGDHAELDPADVAELIAERDAQVDNPFAKDRQIQAIHAARGYLGDKIMRAVPPHRLTDPEAGPLIAVRLRVLTRKTLGGLHTDLQGRVLRGVGAVGAGGVGAAGVGADGAGVGGVGVGGVGAVGAGPVGGEAPVVEGLFAAGEAAGFGGGGMHGHNALEGTFLGGCLFSGRIAGRAAAG